MRTTLLLLALASATAACAPQISTAHAESSDVPRAPVAVVTASLAQQVFTDSAQVTGRLQPARRAEIAAATMGRVVEVLVERGQAIEAGTVIARLDTALARQQRAAAVAQRELAQRQLDQVERELARVDELLAAGVAAEAEAERVHSQREIVLAQIAAAEAQVRVTDRPIAEGEIVAPFAGIVAERFAEPGEVVQPGAPLILLEQADPVRAVLSVPPQLVAAVRTGAQVRLTVPDLPAQAPLTLPIVRVPPSLGASGDLAAEIDVPNPAGALVGGLFVRAELLGAPAEAVGIPTSALLERDGRWRVFTVVDGHVVEHIVDRQRDDAGFVRAPGEFAAGTVVVDRPPADLRDGMTVAVGAAEN